MTTRALKKWSLTKHETITSYEASKQSSQYTLSLDINFAAFPGDHVTMQKKSTPSPTRSFTNDAEDVPNGVRPLPPKIPL